MEYAIKGLKEARIFLLNPQNVMKGKVAPTSIYQQPDPLPEVVEESFVQEDEARAMTEEQPTVPLKNHQGEKCWNNLRNSSHLQV